MEQNRKLTKEELNILAKYEKQLEMAQKGYLRGVSINISKEVSQIVHQKETHYNWGCPSCMLGLWKRAANLYKYNIELQNEKPKRKRKGSDKEV